MKEFRKKSRVLFPIPSKDKTTTFFHMTDDFEEVEFYKKVYDGEPFPSYYMHAKTYSEITDEFKLVVVEFSEYDLIELRNAIDEILENK